MSRRVRWFSEGAASAVATKLDINEFGVDAGPVVYCSTGSEDEDNTRFRYDCEKWFGCEVQVIKSENYENTWDVWQRERYISGIHGAPCSRELKFVPRLNFEEPTDINVFGYTYDANDRKRAERMKDEIPPLAQLVTPLIDKEITKANCLAMVQSAGIELPRSYAMGFPNANCLQSGCAKAQSPRYWALYRHHFPEGFAKTAAISRELGVRMVILGQTKTADGKRKNIRGFLDEIPLDHPMTNPIVPECGFVCSARTKELETE